MMLLHLSDDELGHICKRLDLLSGLGLASTAKGILGQTRRLQLHGSADEAAKTIQRAFRRQYLALVEVRRVGAPEGEAWMPHCDFRTAAEVYGVHPSVVSLVLNPMNPPQLQTNGWEFRRTAGYMSLFKWAADFKKKNGPDFVFTTKPF